MAALEHKIGYDIQDALRSGKYTFGDEGPVTDVAIDIKELINPNVRWDEMIARELMAIAKRPTLIAQRAGLADPKSTFLSRVIKEVTDHDRGIIVTELDYSLNPDGELTWGTPLRNTSHQASMVMVYVNTLGSSLEKLIAIAQANRINIAKAISLVDRGAELPQTISGVPYQTLYHHPLPLYASPAELGWTGNLKDITRLLG